MDNIININNTKSNTLEFEMTIDGADNSKVDCYFVITAKDLDFRFKANKQKENIWNVVVPAMPYLERTIYKCHMCVIADGQYFNPMNGNVNVVGSPEIYISNQTNKTVKSDIEKKEVAKKEEKKRETKRKNESWRGREKSIEQIANELMAKRNKVVTEENITNPEVVKEKVKPVVKESQPASEPVKKDNVIKDTKPIIKENITPFETKKEENKPKTFDIKSVIKEINSKVNEEPEFKLDTIRKIMEMTVKPAMKEITGENFTNEELIKALIEEKKREYHNKKGKEIVIENDDSVSNKVRAILEESGIKVKGKKEKISFVRPNN